MLLACLPSCRLRSFPQHPAVPRLLLSPLLRGEITGCNRSAGRKPKLGLFEAA